MTAATGKATDAAGKVFSSHDEWEAILGRYVRLFSDIEFASVWVFRTFAHAGDIARLCDAPFETRCHNAKDMIKEYCSTRDVKLGNKWVKFFELAMNHGRTVRNKVLHNPLMVSVYENASTGEYSVELQMALMRKHGEYVTFEQLQGHMAALEKLYDDWRRLWAETTQLAFKEPKGSN